MLLKLEHFQFFSKGFGDQDRELAVQGINSPAVRSLDNDYVKVTPFPYQSFLKDIFKQMARDMKLPSEEEEEGGLC